MWLNVARLWAIVLGANLLGAMIFAAMAAHTSVFVPEVQQFFREIGEAAVAPGFSTLVLRGILAGWLIALMVWLLPFAESARIWVIIFLAYAVGLAELPHVIAGSVEAFYLVFLGELSLWRCLAYFLTPTLIGNVIGGVALVAAVAHAEFFAADKSS